MRGFSVVTLCFVVACGGSSERTGSSPGEGGTSGTAGTSPATGGTSTSGTSTSGGSTSAGSDNGAAPGSSGGGTGGGGSTSVPSTGGASGSDSSDETCGPGGCVAGTSNASPIEPPGPVRCGDVACASGEVCCLSTSQCVDPEDAEACPRPSDDGDLYGRAPCSSNAQCKSGEFCQLDNLTLCQGTGHCMPIGNCGRCNGPWESCAVCACDGNTYPNRQTACLAGTNVAPVGAGCGEAMTVGGGGSGGAPTTIVPCGSDDDCGADEACCALTRLCYPTAEPGHCGLPPDGTTFPCLTNDDCPGNEYCWAETCDGPGGCKSRSNDDCGVILDPACGCDGVTYTNASCAATRGVRVAHDGTCTTD